MSRVRLSIVIPVFEEEESLPALTDRLDALAFELRETLDLEVIFVDDHSGDESPGLLKRSCAERERWRYLRLAANSGSHVAILAGLEPENGSGE